MKAISPSRSLVVAADQSGQVVLGPTQWGGVEDLSAVAELARVAGGLHVTVTVRDDHRVYEASRPEYENDSVELFFDLRAHRHRWKNLYETGVFRVTIPVVKEGSVACILGGADLPVGAALNARCRFTPPGYVIEVRISESFLRAIPAPLRSTFGFDFCVNDSDDKGRKAKVCAFGNDFNWRDPKNFRLLALP
jgi:hypothetical protein